MDWIYDYMLENNILTKETELTKELENKLKEMVDDILESFQMERESYVDHYPKTILESESEIKINYEKDVQVDLEKEIKELQDEISYWKQQYYRMYKKLWLKQM